MQTISPLREMEEKENKTKNTSEEDDIRLD